MYQNGEKSSDMESNYEGYVSWQGVTMEFWNLQIIEGKVGTWSRSHKWQDHRRHIIIAHLSNGVSIHVQGQS